MTVKKRRKWKVAKKKGVRHLSFLNPKKKPSLQLKILPRFILKTHLSCDVFTCSGRGKNDILNYKNVK